MLYGFRELQCQTHMIHHPWKIVILSVNALFPTAQFGIVKLFTMFLDFYLFLDLGNAFAPAST